MTCSWHFFTNLQNHEFFTSFPPSEGEFSEILGIFSKVKPFQNPSCYILEKINENSDKKFFWLLCCIKHLWGTKVLYLLLCSKTTSFPPSNGVSKFTFGAIFSRSLWLILFYLKPNLIFKICHHSASVIVCSISALSNDQDLNIWYQLFNSLKLGFEISIWI